MRISCNKICLGEPSNNKGEIIEKGHRGACFNLHQGMTIHFSSCIFLKCDSLAISSGKMEPADVRVHECEMS